MHVNADTLATRRFSTGSAHLISLAGGNEFLSPRPILFASLLLGETGVHEWGEA